MNRAYKRNGTPANMDANAASRVQPAPICSSALGSTKIVEEMPASGERTCR